jgi:hypothetical protein
MDCFGFHMPTTACAIVPRTKHDDRPPEAAGDSAHKLNLGDHGGPGSVNAVTNDAG